MVGRFFRGLIVFVGLVALLIAGLVVAFSVPDVSDADLIAKYGQPPSQFITLPSGARVHYRDQGQRGGPSLILLHGSNASLHTWEP